MSWLLWLAITWPAVVLVAAFLIGRVLRTADRADERRRRPVLPFRRELTRERTPTGPRSG